MSLESFYGGRIGAPFIIVERFDGINIPENTYKKVYLAKNDTNTRYIYDINNNKTSSNLDNFIVRTADNYNNYLWELTTLNGNSVNTVTPTGIEASNNLPSYLSKGMVQCFQKGGETTNIVNYGEYVIIDTLDKDDPDNGKVFRRGMNYQYNEKENPTAGGEYIGQIVGPQGPAPELAMDHYGTIDANKEFYKHQFKGEYQVDSYNDLIPGMEYITQAEGSITTFNDKIKWITASLEDQWGSIHRCVIGFKIPYLVLEFEANSINPYNEDYRQGTPGNWSYHNLISEDTEYYHNKKWDHPFFEKWQIKVPSGLHGINSTNIEIVHTKTKTVDMNDGKGVDYYQEQDEEKVRVGTLEESVNVLIEKFFDPENPKETTYGGKNPYDPIYIKDDEYCKILLDVEGTPTEFYVKQEDCYMDIIRYREINFDNYENGEIRFYKIGDYNDIQKITLSEEGILTIYYSNADPNPKNLEEVIRWIYNDKNQDPETRTKGIEIDDWGTLQVNYNTKKNGVREVDRFPNQLKWIKNIELDDYGTVKITYNVPNPDNPNERETKVFDNIIDWIEEVSLTQKGEFKVLFNNNSIQGGEYKTTLEWIDFININEDGTIDFYLNTNHEKPVYTSLLRLKIIDDIEIQTTNSSWIEGTGDQKIHITYNTEDEDNPGQKETAVIGNPLNYIIETVVVSSSIDPVEYPDAKYSHLLVYYSDPALRQSLQDKWVKYPSQKYPGKVWTEWVDLGDIRGAQNGIHIITNVTSLNDLKDPNNPNRYLSPEELKSGAEGWNVTLTESGSTITELLAYDYNTKEWYSIGSINSSLVNPKNSIVVSPRDDNYNPIPADVADLQNGGIWFATETQYYAY